MDIHEIIEQLPHRYPFLLVDRVLECEPGQDFWWRLGIWIQVTGQQT